MADLELWNRMRRHTAARIGLGRAGSGLSTPDHLAFQLAHAEARDAVHVPLDFGSLAQEIGRDYLTVASAAPDRRTYLTRPDLGRRLKSEDYDRLKSKAGAGCDLAVVVADGLSARAVQQNAAPLLAALLPQLTGWRLSPVVLVNQGRVAIGDAVGEALGAAMVLMLIGERPGLSSPDSLGAYITWEPRTGRTDAERNCVSNIRPAGLDYPQAVHKLLYLLSEARRRQLTGVDLKDEAGLLPANPMAAALP